ncbi:hypothetical protein ACHAW6_008154 [Cyclotella cf. meneghiniana]
MYRHFMIQLLSHPKQSCNPLESSSKYRTMPVSPYPNFPSQPNRHNTSRAPPTICYQQPLLQMWAVNYSFMKPDPTTRLWQVFLQSIDGHKIVPHNAMIASPTKPTLQLNSIYECENTKQFINFYHPTMG